MRRPNPHTVVIRVWDRDAQKLRKVERGGKLFDVAGVFIKLFPIRVLAEAMDRRTRCIVDWERAGLFPKPMYNVEGSNTKRWYSESQIQTINEIWLRYREQGKGKHFRKEDFLREIAETFYTVDLQKADND